VGLLRLVAASAFVLTATFGCGDVAESQNAPNCPYRNGLPSVRACSLNSNPSPIPGSLGGNRMVPTECADALISGLASLYSYDDPDCHPAGTLIQTGLRFVADGADHIPDYYKPIAEHANFKGAIFCDTSSNFIILAFRGSVEITNLLSFSGIADWIATNLAQHIGQRPDQYGVASDVAQLIRQDWKLGAFDNVCGKGRPEFLLAGHSKGGGQAQFAAVHLKLRAIVFNSDPVNPLIFSDFVRIRYAPAIVQFMINMVRAGQSIVSCRHSQPHSNISKYMASGAIKDIRMVNDPLVLYLLPHCSFPHAPIEWLVDSLDCSTDSGHEIVTVIRELRACAPSP
jgi:hypothetical protein